MTDLTAANAIITLTVPGVFNTPQQLQGFAADDIFDTGEIDAGEESMGVDGLLSAGFVFMAVPQNYTLQADSDSNAIFDNWYAFEKSNLVKIAVFGETTLTGLGTTWVMTRGFLKRYTPIVSAGKIVKPRKYGIVWNLVNPQPA